MSSWLRCEVEPGMLPGEYAVETETAAGSKVSLFAPEDKVRASEKLMRIEVLEESSGAILVRLPSPALEISSQEVTVPRKSVVTKG